MIRLGASLVGAAAIVAAVAALPTAATSTRYGLQVGGARVGVLTVHVSGRWRYEDAGGGVSRGRWRALAGGAARFSRGGRTAEHGARESSTWRMLGEPGRAAVLEPDGPQGAAPWAWPFGAVELRALR